MIAKNILLRARLSTLLLVIGSALFLASPTFADEAVSVPANTVDFQAPVEDAPLAVAATSIADLGITPLTDAQIEEILNEHNMYRARHQAPALEWDAFLARDAERALGNCRPFSSRSRYGRNEFTSVETDFYLAVETWYAQIKGYHFEDPSQSTRDSGTFSQLVWKNSKRIGCAVKECLSNEEGEGGNGGESSFVHLCEYDPPGNTVTRLYTLYKKNVLPARKI
ncbi:CAP domain-containing protein [Linnemannia elongata]|nr:CAP domain-containing protein [Linnemannia elongata]